MKNILVLGAGHIGSVIASSLAGTGDYCVTLADQKPDQAANPQTPQASDRFAENLVAERIAFHVVDVTDPNALRAALSAQDIVVSALPFFLNVGIAEAARDCAVHYFDLTEDVKTTARIAELARGAETAFVPQCGLAPGAIGIIGHHMALLFEKTFDVHMRVGALPLYPTNALKYNLSWSTEGLINEYCNPCEALRDGEQVDLLPLEGLESFSLDGVDYEAFNTSGGLGTLPTTLQGRVRNLDYKTIRYPGHCAIMQLLLHDLNLREDREMLRRIFERAIPETEQDVVVIMVNAIGEHAGHLLQRTFNIKVYGDGKHSAIQATTAAGLCAMIDLFVAGQLPQAGFVHQEDCTLAALLGNRFGRIFQRQANDRVATSNSLVAAQS